MKTKIYVSFIFLFLITACSSNINDQESLKIDSQKKESGVMHIIPEDSVSNNSF